MKTRRIICAVLCLCAATTFAQNKIKPKVLQDITVPKGAINLVPNPEMNSPANPLAGYRYEYPFFGQYVNNHKYVKRAMMGGRSCAMLDLPAGVPGNQGGKIETAWIKAEPGATYIAMVDAWLGNLSAKIWAESYVTDPQPDKRPEQSIYRYPACKTWTVADPAPNARVQQFLPILKDMPALADITRAAFAEPQFVRINGSWNQAPAKNQWVTWAREFEIPTTMTVGGEEKAPEFITIKAWVFAAIPGPGQSYFTNFRLYKIK